MRSKDSLFKNKNEKSNSRSINLTKTKTDSDNYEDNKVPFDQEVVFAERIPLNLIKGSENIIPKLDLQNAKSYITNPVNSKSSQSKSSRQVKRNDENDCNFSNNESEKLYKGKPGTAGINKYSSVKSIKSSPKIQNDFSSNSALKAKFQYNTLGSPPESKSSKQDEVIINEEVLQSFNNSKESKIPFDISKTLNDYQLRSQN